MTKQFYKASDISEMLEISDSKAYQLIRQMNAELESKGFLTCRGRVPVAYVEQRFFGVDTNEQRKIS